MNLDQIGPFDVMARAMELQNRKNKPAAAALKAIPAASKPAIVVPTIDNCSHVIALLLAQNHVSKSFIPGRIYKITGRTNEYIEMAARPVNRAYVEPCHPPPENPQWVIGLKDAYSLTTLAVKGGNVYPLVEPAYPGQRHPYKIRGEGRTVVEVNAEYVEPCHGPHIDNCKQVMIKDRIERQFGGFYPIQSDKAYDVIGRVDGHIQIEDDDKNVIAILSKRFHVVFPPK